MKKNTMRIWMIAAVTGIMAYAGFVAFKGPDNNGDKEKLILKAVLTMMQQVHFKNPPLDDNFSHRLYDTYMDRLDGMKRFLIMEDLDLLDDYQDSLDDQIRNEDLKFFEISYKLINNSIEKTRKWYPELLSRPFDFTIKDSIETDGEKRSYAKDDAELKEFWRSYLKYETLTRLSDKIKEQETATEVPEGGKKSIAELEADARKDVLEVFDEWYERMDKVRRSDRFEMYVNSITNVYDPHSDYFNPKEKEDFDINMSGRLEGIGARLQMDGDFTKVVAVIPGGPAWKQKELEVDDKIFKVQQETETEPVDVTGWLVDEVVTLVRGPKGTKVSLTVRKTDGSVREITILRDEVILDEGFAKSAILELEGEVGNVGYITLPKFYADFENPNGRSCAEDVEIEVKKLMQANVKGIILDLRNNSGGSLNDVVQMTGLFIEDGPIVQVKGRDAAPYVLKDKDEKVVYTGPLVVMVNTQSASASEILAAAIQDYGRGVIVGSRSTFGKGTVQRFFDLDKTISGFDEFKPLGDVKITLQKFYRVNGGSTQLKGVTPDINLPDNQQYIDSGEKEMEYPMEWTEIAPVQFGQDIVDLHKMDQLKAKSDARIKASPQFSKVITNALRIKDIRNESVVPLQLDEFRALDIAREEESKEFKKSFGKIDKLKTENLAIDLQSIQVDSSKVGRNEAWLETMGKDIYLEETLLIMKDLMSFNHKS
ncbi:MAG: carboxy terminal-processing peptidase [Saprospiraceae bacterium]|nr:carboxy terminal-processing peptidase [Candidatus Opimibacter skivensis]